MIILGCDSGSTKIAYAVCSGDGRLLARREFPGITLFRGGQDTWMADLAGQISQTLADAGLHPDDVDSAAFGLTGYGETEDSVRLMEEGAARALPRARRILANDSVVGWSGALRCQPGIHVVSGTGSVAYGEDGRGGAARAGGWSVYFGDEGSSYWAAVKGINAFFRQADGRMPRTMLFDYFMELFRLSDPLHMPGAFEEATEGGKADRVAAFQRHVSELAKRGDPCALEIYRQAGEALAALVTALKTRLHFPEDETIRVTYSGGLFRNGACVLDPFRAITEAQGCRVETPAYGPLAGAVGYAARDLLSAGALERVMAAADA